MILDTSALIAILYGEPEAQGFTRLILEADACRLSVASHLELTMVVESQIGAEGTRQADHFLRRAGTILEPVTLDQGELARQAFFDFGKGRHPAGLNFGDCFAYALAKTRGEPLLFKGNDFARTDIEPAWRPSPPAGSGAGAA